MATEEQTDLNGGGFTGVRAEYPRQGQRLTISNRVVSKLGFYLGKAGTISGDVDFKIRSVSDDGVLLTKLWGDANDLPSSAVYKEVTFDAPATINEEVRITCEFSGGSAGNYVKIQISGSDVKADEVSTTYTDSWADDSNKDLLYIYTYSTNTTAPSTTTQAATSVGTTTATANGNVTNLGIPAATQYGFCYATFPNPTTTNDKTEKGAPSSTGAYTSSLTGLSTNTRYYLRAYITSTAGTFYGAEVQFVTTSDVPAMTTGSITDVGAITALGHGAIVNGGGSAVTQHGVCWNTSTNPTTSNDKTTDGATTLIGWFSTLMESLSAGTLYYVRAYATNSSGTGYGANKTFTTVATGVPIVTTDLMTSVLPTRATGNGTILSIGGSSVTQHGHCWGTTVNPTTSNNKTSLGTGSVASFISFITGLTAGTPYYTRAYATNSYGTAYGDNVFFNQVSGDTTGEQSGNTRVLGEHLVYTSKTGVQRALLGAEF